MTTTQQQLKLISESQASISRDIAETKEFADRSLRVVRRLQKKLTKLLSEIHAERN